MFCSTYRTYKGIYLAVSEQNILSQLRSIKRNGFVPEAVLFNLKRGMPECRNDNENTNKDFIESPNEMTA